MFSHAKRNFCWEFPAKKTSMFCRWGAEGWSYWAAIPEPLQSGARNWEGWGVNAIQKLWQLWEMGGKCYGKWPCRKAMENRNEFRWEWWLAQWPHGPVRSQSTRYWDGPSDDLWWFDVRRTSAIPTMALPCAQIFWLTKLGSDGFGDIQCAVD